MIGNFDILKEHVKVWITAFALESMNQLFDAQASKTGNKAFIYQNLYYFTFVFSHFWDDIG